MNRYYFLVVWISLLAMPCFAMMSPSAFANFDPTQKPVENILPEEPDIASELTGVYREGVVTAEEPSEYTLEQIQEVLRLQNMAQEEELRPSEEHPQEEIVEEPAEPQKISFAQLQHNIDLIENIGDKNDIIRALKNIFNQQQLLIKRSRDPQSHQNLCGQIISALNSRLHIFSAPNSTIIQSLIEAEELIAQLITISTQPASQGMDYLQQIVNLLSSNANDREQQAEGILQTIRELLPQAPAQPVIPTQGAMQQIPTPASPQPSTPASKPFAAPSAPSVSPTAPSNPVTPPPARQAAPGKAHESITKANSKLSSALRRLDAIKGYYKEISQEERAVIKKKAENVLKEYQPDINKFVKRIEQVKSKLGGKADQSKLAPFNTFIDLTNKLSQGIKRL